MKFSENNTNDVHAEGQGQRSKVKIPEVKPIFPNFGVSGL